MDTFEAPSIPREQTRNSTAIRHLASALLTLRASLKDLAPSSMDAASSALVLGLLEQGTRSLAFEQLRTVFHADALKVHRLDPDTANTIDQLAAAPHSLSDGHTGVPVERMCSGMAPHRNTASYLQAHLHISATEARRRLTGARLLTAPHLDADPGSSPGEDHGPGSTEALPAFPVLAQAAADGSTDVGTMAQLAGRLESMQPRLTGRQDAANLVTAIEESLVHEARTHEPRHCHKALTDWETFLARNGAPITDEQIRAKRGLFYKGYREGCDEFLLRCDPIDSETILSFGEAFSNPRSDKLPPASVSTQPTTNGSSPEVSDAFGGISPAGTPAPGWALAPGMDPDQVPVSEWSTGGLGGTGALVDALETRSTAQLLLDGIIAAINGALTGTGASESGGLKIRLGVLIDYRSLLGHCEAAGITAHGRSISAANIRRLACNAGILPAVLGSNGEVLDLGREVRGFSTAQRKALAIRDRGCVIPGCQRCAATCEGHHVVPWSQGGETSVGNGSIICAYHHAMVHAGLVTLKMLGGVPFVVARAGEARGDPQRNLYWHPELRSTGYTPPMITD